MVKLILKPEGIQAVAKLLELVQKMDISSGLCPADILMDVMIDCGLQLRNQAKEHGPWSEVSNPTIEFCEGPSQPGTGGSPQTRNFSFIPVRGTPGSGVSSGLFVRRGEWKRGTSDYIPDEAGLQARQKIVHPGFETMDDPSLPQFFEDLIAKLVQVKHLHHSPKALYAKENESRQHPVQKISRNSIYYFRRKKERYLRSKH